MDKTKYEREYTAFLESSRKRIRVAKKVDVKQIISTLQTILRTPNLENDIATGIKRDVIGRLPPKNNVDLVVTMSVVSRIIGILNERYDEASSGSNGSLERIILALEKVHEDLGHLSDEIKKKASIDETLEDIEKSI